MNHPPFQGTGTLLDRLIFLLLPVVLLSLPAAGLIDPDIQWRILETENFEIIYDAKDKDLARRYALYAETAHKDLLPLFQEAPDKTVVWINNLTDISNGSATPTPYPKVIIYPVNPVIDQSIGEYGHWGRELMTHEYVHILQFQPRRGIYKFLRYIFGNIVAPNALLPRWWLEGMAVELESQFSSGGRLRSNRQQALLRALSGSDKLAQEDISRVNEVSIPDWLGGQRPYLLGGILWNEVVNDQGNQGIYELNQAHAGHLPYLINGPVRDNTEKDYPEWLEQAYAQLHDKTSQLKERFDEPRSQSPSTSSASLATSHHDHHDHDSSSEDHVSVQRGLISPNRVRYAYVERSPEFAPRLVMLSRLVQGKTSSSFSLAPKEIVTAVSPWQRFSWTPDSQAVVYDKIGRYRDYYNFSDLHLYHFARQESRQLTEGLRAREPAVSPDGQQIVFIRTLGDQSQLAQVDIEGQNLQILFQPSPGQRLSHPEFLNRQQVVFSQRNAKGQEFLRLYDLQKRKVRTLLKDFEPAFRPRRTSAGLLFVSEKSGTGNIYLASRDLRSATPVSDVFTYADDPDWDPVARELLFSQLTAEGYQIQMLASDKERPAQQNPVALTETLPYDRKPYRKPSLSVKAKDKSYSPLKYLIPRYWIPSAVVSTGGWFLSGSTGSNDPVGKNAYSLLAGFDTGTEKLSTVFSYTNQSLSFPLSLRLSDVYDFFGSTSTIRRQTDVRASGSRRFSLFGRGWRWGAAWDYNRTDVFDEVTVFQGPEAFLRFSALTRRGQQLVPESGGDLLLSSTQYIGSLGDTGFNQMNVSGSIYLSKWLPKRHVLSTKLRSIYAPGNDSLVIGPSTAAGNFESALVSHQLLMRGYTSGNFIAQNAINASFDYVFPLKYSYSGFGTAPVFSRHWHGRLVADLLTLDGLAFDETGETCGFTFCNAEFGETLYAGVGGEVHWSTTIGYHLPLRFFVGLYYGLNDDATGGFQSFFGLGL